MLTHSGPRANSGLGHEISPDKTFIGRTERGFDFLGYHFGSGGLGVAKATIEKFIKRASRLYEQKRIDKVAPDALGMYVHRWCAWASGGLVGTRAATRCDRLLQTDAPAAAAPRNHR